MPRGEYRLPIGTVRLHTMDGRSIPWVKVGVKHRLATRCGWAIQARVVFDDFYRIRLQKSDAVLHRDGDCTNNNPSNLYLRPKSKRIVRCCVCSEPTLQRDSSRVLGYRSVCSKKCRYALVRIVMRKKRLPRRPCQRCGNPLKRAGSRYKFCSRKCAAQCYKREPPLLLLKIKPCGIAHSWRLYCSHCCLLRRTKMVWKKLMAELKKMRRATAANAYRTAEIIRDLFANQNWIDTECKGDKFTADKSLNEYAGLYGMAATELSELINYIPDKQRWLEGRLDLLKDEMCTARNRERTLAMKSRQQNDASKNGLSPFGRGKNKMPVAGNVANPPPKPEPAIKSDVLESISANAREASEKLVKSYDEAASMSMELSKERERRIAAEKQVAELQARNNDLEAELGGLRLRFAQLQQKAQ